MVVSTETRATISQKFDLFRGGTGGLDNWLGKETPDQVFDALANIEKQPLSRARFSQLLTLAHEAPLSDALFRYYWLSVPERHPYSVIRLPFFNREWTQLEHIVSLDHLYWGLYRFYVDALLCFGNIRTAFHKLRSLSENELTQFFQNRRIDTAALSKRGEPIGLSNIGRDSRYLISEMACKSFDAADKPDSELSLVLSDLYSHHIEAGGGSITVEDLLNGAYNEGKYVDMQLQLNPLGR